MSGSHVGAEATGARLPADRYIAGCMVICHAGADDTVSLYRGLDCVFTGTHAEAIQWLRDRGVLAGEGAA